MLFDDLIPEEPEVDFDYIVQMFKDSFGAWTDISRFIAVQDGKCFAPRKDPELIGDNPIVYEVLDRINFMAGEDFDYESFAEQYNLKKEVSTMSITGIEIVVGADTRLLELGDEVRGKIVYSIKFHPDPAINEWMIKDDNGDKIMTITNCPVIAYYE